MTSVLRRTLAGSLLTGALVASAAWQAHSTVVTEDRNHDGRPDVWRTYDAAGRITAVSIDTNFDGRSDVEERYDDGALIERDVDRDFDRHVDVEETFDPSTRSLVRVVVDSDGDGVSDLLVLFQDGRPVYSEWAPTHLARAIDASPSGDDLVQLKDVFADKGSLRAALNASSAQRCVPASRARDLPPDATHAPCPIDPACVVPTAGDGACGRLLVALTPSRAPPASTFRA